MKFYLAPLEGITGYIYRNAQHDFFGAGIDKYFMPFLAPHTKRSFNAKEKNDILPEHNAEMYAVPQILTNSAADFLRIEKDLWRVRLPGIKYQSRLSVRDGGVQRAWRGFPGFAGKTRSVFGRDLFKDRGEDFLKDQDRDGGTGGIFPAA